MRNRNTITTTMRIIVALVATAVIATTAASASSSLHLAPLSPPPIAAAAPIAKKPKWEFMFDSPQDAMTPATTADRVYVPTNTKLYALSASSGALLWSLPYALGNVSRIDTSDELVVVGTRDAMIAVDVRTGALAWSYRPGPPTGELSAECPEGVYPRFGHSSPGSERGIYVTACYAPLVKLSMAGKVLWTAPSSTGGALHYASESKRHSLVFFNSYDLSDKFRRYFIFLRADTGAVVRIDGGRRRNNFITLDAASGLLFERLTDIPKDYDLDSHASMLSVFELPEVTRRYTLHYHPAVSAEYSVTGTALYTRVELKGYTYNFFKYPDVHAIKPVADYRERQQAQWNTSIYYFSVGFASCSKGLVDFGGGYVDGYDERDGSHVWRYDGFLAAAGAVIPSTDTIIAVLSKKVVALDF